jgi:hypothetical protein
VRNAARKIARAPANLAHVAPRIRANPCRTSLSSRQSPNFTL